MRSAYYILFLSYHELSPLLLSVASSCVYSSLTVPVVGRNGILTCTCTYHTTRATGRGLHKARQSGREETYCMHSRASCLTRRGHISTYITGSLARPRNSLLPPPSLRRLVAAARAKQRMQHVAARSRNWTNILPLTTRVRAQRTASYRSVWLLAFAT